MVNRDPSIERTLEELIHRTFSKNNNYYKCTNCKMYFDEIAMSQRLILENNKFLIIKINNTLSNVFLKTKIKEFDPDRFYLPLNNAHCFYQLKAAVVFEPNDEENCFNGGHYICWQRISNGWVKISDTNGIFYSNFLQGLIGVYILIFEKINIILQ